ncbi:hypothetical protein KP509_20G051900 [Ceratopteris richardii]|nr:hypothetical protein KP509_20G051900 [Ceratopteris richardii]
MDSDGRITATAQHIISIMGSDKATDVLRILSTYDNRFSRFIVSSSTGRDVQEERDDPPLEAPAGAAEIGETVLLESLDIVQHWESSESASGTYIWSGNQADSSTYLDAVERIQEFVNKPGAADTTNLDRARDALMVAMLRLEKEFFHLLESHAKSMDPDKLQEMIQDDKDSDEGDVSTADGLEKTSGSDDLRQGSKSFKSVTIDLLPGDVVADLREIASRMLKSGYQAESTQIYVSSRKSVLEECLQSLGFQKLSIDDVQKISWNDLGNKISRWIQILKLAVGILLRSEKEICRSVFESNYDLADGVFNQLARGPITLLLNFGEAVAIAQRAPEKLFKLLDMYEDLRDLLPGINDLFVGESGATVREEGATILTWIGEAVKGTFAAFEAALQREASQNPVPGGAVHPLTRYVMNYIRFCSDYTETLNHLLGERNLTQAVTNAGSEESNREPFSAVILTVLDLLVKHMDKKANLYKDAALSSIFLMNNLCYMVQKAKDAEVRKLVSDEWIRRHNAKMYQYHSEYIRKAWTNVLSYLGDEGMNLSSGSMSSSTKNQIKEKFRNFNMAFEENVKTQSSWFVSDPQLCVELQISITRMILPAYQNFLTKFQKHIDVYNGRERYAKYTPDEIEENINALFEGIHGHSDRRRG